MEGEDLVGESNTMHLPEGQVRSVWKDADQAIFLGGNPDHLAHPFATLLQDVEVVATQKKRRRQCGSTGGEKSLHRSVFGAETLAYLFLAVAQRSPHHCRLLHRREHLANRILIGLQDKILGTIRGIRSRCNIALG